MTEASRTFSPSIDAAANAQAQSTNPDPVAAAVLAVGKDIAWHLGRLVDHVQVEQLVNAEQATFGRQPAGAYDPRQATKDDVRTHRPLTSDGQPIVS